MKRLASNIPFFFAGYIKEYLCLVPHQQKFSFRETADVLYRSASSKTDFSGYRAAVAWNAISLYAGNLLAQPWRKEYRTIKPYSGFYKHEIEANLVGAEIMFEVMGYKHIGDMVMYLEGPICPDRVANVSRDSLVAFVECQVNMIHSFLPCQTNIKFIRWDRLVTFESYI